jgi:hypothetical protein
MNTKEKNMKCNIGKTDRILRIILGIVLVFLGIIYNNWLWILGLVPLITAVFSFCPMYLPFHINTCKKEEKTAK